jgi:hypothetical protein
MAHRTVSDRVGTEWDVWEVNPAGIDQSMRAAGFTGRVSEGLRGGWLAFQSHHEKRRLSPIPKGWVQISDAELLELLEQAPKAGKPTRLIE